MSSLWIKEKKSLIWFLKECCLKGVQPFPHGNHFPEPLGACGKQLHGGLAVGVDTLCPSLQSSLCTKMDNFNPNFTLRSVTNRCKTCQEGEGTGGVENRELSESSASKTSPG